MCLHFIVYLTSTYYFLMKGYHRSLVYSINLTNFVSLTQSTSQLQLEMLTVFNWLLNHLFEEACDQHITNEANFIKNVNTDNSIC